MLSSPEYGEADAIFAFYPVKGEIDIRPLLKKALDEKKALLLPRVEGKIMTFQASIVQLTKSVWNLINGESPNPGPDATVCRGKEYSRALMLVPGVAFTVRGKRLGRGGGFYDRYLTENGDFILAGTAFPCQIVVDLPVEPHDVRMDRVFY